MVFNQLPEHSSPFGAQSTRTQQAEYRPNPSTALLVMFCLFLITQMTFIHPCRLSFACTQHTQMHTNAAYSVMQTGNVWLFPGDLYISVAVIHHQAVNIQVVLISVLGNSTTYSNVPVYFIPHSFIFISLIRCRPCSSINTGTHADRRSQSTVIGWSFCHSALACISVQRKVTRCCEANTQHHTQVTQTFSHTNRATVTLCSP